MDRQTERAEFGDEPRSVPDYEPPRVERVLSGRELEHEVLYAGILASGR